MTVDWFAPAQVGTVPAGELSVVQLAPLVLEVDRWADAYRFQVTSTGAGVWAVPLIYAVVDGQPTDLFLSGPAEPIQWVQGSQRDVARFVLPAGTWAVGLGQRGTTPAKFQSGPSRVLGEATSFGTAGATGWQFTLDGDAAPAVAPTCVPCAAVPRIHFREA